MLEGDVFVSRLEIEANARLDYAFKVKRTSDGQAVELWKGANSAGDYYTKNLTVANADESVPDPRADVSPKSATGDEGGPAHDLASARTEDGSQPPLASGSTSGESIEVFTKAVWSAARAYQRKERVIQVQVRYRNADAGKVLLVWGLNNYALVPKALPPETFLTYKDTHINTPMTRQGDLFVVDFEVKPDTRLHYAFLITETSNGEPAQIWRIDKNSGKEHTEILTVAGAQEVVDQDSVISRRGSWNLAITIGVSAMIGLWVLFDLRRRQRPSPTIVADDKQTP